jgi:ABC-type nickel/cobalt efflux system permease component RcnA
MHHARYERVASGDHVVQVRVFASIGAILLGIAIGLRHALEPDHLAAVSTLVIEARSARRAMWLGVAWGIGHTISLVVVGSLLLATGTMLPDRAATGFELAVAVMLVALGIRSILRAVRDAERGPVHRHHHRRTAHDHAGPQAHVHVGGRALAWRPLVVGLVHGLAGSGAITALVFAELPSLASRVVYIVVFGAGSIVGMAITSGIAGASLGRIAGARRCAFSIAVGVLSIGVGIAWAIPELV